MSGLCKDCRWWIEPDRMWSEGVVGASEKVCGLTGPAKFRMAVRYPESGPWLVTAPDFGCVHWMAGLVVQG